MVQRLLQVCPGALLAAIIATHGHTAEPLANAGTLTCTLSPSEKILRSSETAAEVSCKFNSISGVDVNLSGHILRLSAEREREAKVVVAWSVLAPTTDVPAQKLSGRYTGTLPVSGSETDRFATTPGTLFGSESSGIELRPLTVERQDLPNAGLTILELEITVVKI